MSPSQQHGAHVSGVNGTVRPLVGMRAHAGRLLPPCQRTPTALRPPQQNAKPKDISTFIGVSAAFDFAIQRHNTNMDVGVPQGIGRA